MIKCDHCEAECEGTQMICVSVKSHKLDDEGRAVQARVNTQRWWRFCSKLCAEAWYETDTDEHFMPTGPAPERTPCEAHPDGQHDFSERGPDLEIHARSIEGGVISSSPQCRHCKKSSNEVGGSVPHLIDEGEHQDCLLRVLAVHVTAKDGTELCDHQLFDHPHELNTYWKTPGAPVPLSLTDPTGAGALAAEETKE